MARDYIWVPCQRCDAEGEVHIGKPGDMFRFDYCPQCVGGMVKVRVDHRLNRLSELLGGDLCRAAAGLNQMFVLWSSRIQSAAEAAKKFNEAMIRQDL